jgi:hypothetical protein
MAELKHSIIMGLYTFQLFGIYQIYPDLRECVYMDKMQA